VLLLASEVFSILDWKLGWDIIHCCTEAVIAFASLKETHEQVQAVPSSCATFVTQLTKKLPAIVKRLILMLPDNAISSAEMM
jgi:hypothetical protein